MKKKFALMNSCAKSKMSQFKIKLPELMFNNSVISSTDTHKHLGIFLDNKLSFNYHLKDKISIANKGIGTIKRLYKFLPRSALINIYKAFVLTISGLWRYNI